MKSLRKNTKYIILFIVAFSSIVGIGVYYYYNSNTFGIAAVCPSYSIFGIYCPGCGSQRALHALLHGRFHDSFRFNPILIPSLLLLVGIGIQYFLEKIWKVQYSFAFFNNKQIMYIIFILLIVYMIMRNIPITLFDGLRPPY